MDFSGRENNLKWKIQTTGIRCKKTGTLLSSHQHKIRKEDRIQSAIWCGCELQIVQTQKVSTDLRILEVQVAFILAAEMDLRVLDLGLRCYSQVWKRRRIVEVSS